MELLELLTVAPEVAAPSATANAAVGAATTAAAAAAAAAAADADAALGAGAGAAPAHGPPEAVAAAPVARAGGFVPLSSSDPAVAAWARATLAALRAPGAAYGGNAVEEELAVAEAAEAADAAVDAAADAASETATVVSANVGQSSSAPAPVFVSIAAARATVTHYLLAATALNAETHRLGGADRQRRSLAKVKDLHSRAQAALAAAAAAAATATAAGAAMAPDAVVMPPEFAVQLARANTHAGDGAGAWDVAMGYLDAHPSDGSARSVAGLRSVYSVLLQCVQAMPGLSPEQRAAAAAACLRRQRQRACALAPSAAALDTLMFLATRTRDWRLSAQLGAVYLCQTHAFRAAAERALRRPDYNASPAVSSGGSSADSDDGPFDLALVSGADADALAAAAAAFPDADWRAALEGRVPALAALAPALQAVREPRLRTYLGLDARARDGAAAVAAAAEDTYVLVPPSTAATTGPGAASDMLNMSTFFGPSIIAALVDVFHLDPAAEPQARPSKGSSKGKVKQQQQPQQQQQREPLPSVAPPRAAPPVSGLPAGVPRSALVTRLFELSQALDALLTPRLLRSLLRALLATTPHAKAALAAAGQLVAAAVDSGVVADQSLAVILLAYGFGQGYAVGAAALRLVRSLQLPVSPAAVKVVLQGCGRHGDRSSVYGFFPALLATLPAEMRALALALTPVSASGAKAGAVPPAQQAEVQAFLSQWTAQQRAQGARAQAVHGSASADGPHPFAPEQSPDLLEAVFLTVQARPPASPEDVLMCEAALRALAAANAPVGRGADSGRLFTVRAPCDALLATEQVAAMAAPYWGWRLLLALAALKETHLPWGAAPLAPAAAVIRVISNAGLVCGLLARPDEARGVLAAAGPAATAARLGAEAGAEADVGTGAGGGLRAGADVAAADPPAVGAARAKELSGRANSLLQVLRGGAGTRDAVPGIRKEVLSAALWRRVAAAATELLDPLRTIGAVNWVAVPAKLRKPNTGMIASKRPPDATPRYIPSPDE
jgi:hypothetical protein